MLNQQTINADWFLRGVLVFIGFMVAVASLAFVGTTQSASAAGCRHYDAAVQTWNIAPSGSEYGTWYYADMQTIPYDSACSDINLTRGSIESTYGGYTACSSFRVRFYPSSGGSYTNSPKFACTGYGTVLLATSVKNGTAYRIETSSAVRFHIFD